MAGHEFITVLNRRWCIGCDLFQSKKPSQAWWEPESDCEQYTPWAKDKLASGEAQKVSDDR